MSNRAEFEHATAGTQWENEFSTVDTSLFQILRGTPSSSPLPPPPPPPPVFAGVFNTQPQPVQLMSQGHGGCAPLEAAPQWLEQSNPLMAAPGLNLQQAAPIIYQGPLYGNCSMQSSYQYSQPGAYSQGQV